MRCTYLFIYLLNLWMKACQKGSQGIWLRVKVCMAAGIPQKATIHAQATDQIWSFQTKKDHIHINAFTASLITAWSGSWWFVDILGKDRKYLRQVQRKKKKKKEFKKKSLPHTSLESFVLDHTHFGFNSEYKYLTAYLYTLRTNSYCAH